MIIGISGGSGSGKTTIARRIIDSLGAANAVFLQQDSYYRDLSGIPFESRRLVNFDHPDALDNELMFSQLAALREGKSINYPIYDFTVHSRKAESIPVESKPITIVEGILIFYDPRIRGLMDLKVFVDCDADMRFIRRLKRDILERGRTMESVIAQYMAAVRPMHKQFIEPAMRWADIVISEGGAEESNVDPAVNQILSMIQASRK